MRVQAGRKQKPTIPEPEPAEETSLSERKIKTLPISPYSSKTWLENPAKVLIPKDRPWEGAHPPLPTSKHHTQKNTSFQATTKKFIFRRTDGEPRTASQIFLRPDTQDLRPAPRILPSAENPRSYLPALTKPPVVALITPMPFRSFSL